MYLNNIFQYKVTSKISETWHVISVEDKQIGPCKRENVHFMHVEWGGKKDGKM